MNLTKNDFYDFLNGGKCAIMDHDKVKGVRVYAFNKRLKEVTYFLSKDHKVMSSTEPSFLGFITINPIKDTINFKVYKDMDKTGLSIVVNGEAYPVIKDEGFEPLSMFDCFNDSNVNTLSNGDSFKAYRRHVYYMGERTIDEDYVKTITDCLNDISSFFDSIEFNMDFDADNYPKGISALNIFNGLEYAKDLFFYASDEMDKESYFRALSYIDEAYNTNSPILKGAACFMYYSLYETILKHCDFEFIDRNLITSKRALEFLIEGSEYRDIDSMRALSAIYLNKERDIYDPEKAISLLQEIVRIQSDQIMKLK